MFAAAQQHHPPLSPYHTCVVPCFESFFAKFCSYNNTLVCLFLNPGISFIRFCPLLRTAAATAAALQHPCARTQFLASSAHLQNSLSFAQRRSSTAADLKRSLSPLERELFPFAHNSSCLATLLNFSKLNFPPSHPSSS